MRHLRNDDGQSTIEWLGVGAVIVAIILVVVSFAPGAGGAIGDAVECLIQRVTGGGSCGRPEVAEGGPTDPCVVASEATNFELGVRVVVVNVDGSYGFIVEELSDGTVRVTEVVRGEGSASVGVGGGVAVNAGDQRAGARAAAGARAGGFIELGDSWVFPDRAQADGHIENTLVDRALDSNPITGLPLVNDVAEGALGLIGVGGNDVDGERDGTRVDVGILGSAVAEAVGGIASTEISAGLEAAAGLTMRGDGGVDVAYVVSGDIAGSLGIPALADLDLGASGSVELTISFGPDGSIETVGLSATATTTNDSGIAADDPAQALDDLLNSVADPQDATRQVVLDYELDIDSPELRGAVVDLIGALAPGGTPAGEGAEALGQAIIEESTVTKRVYDVDEGTYGIDASGDFIIGGRLSANLVRQGSTLVEASYFDPVTGTFQPWINCTG